MAGNFELKTIPQCNCNHSQDAHDAGLRRGCGFCHCGQFVLDKVVQEQVWSVARASGARTEDRSTRLAKSLTGSVFARLRSRVGFARQ